jgi:hypothetical protein
MSHVWATSSDGDLLRADQIRQLDTAEAQDEWTEIAITPAGPGWTVEVDSTPRPQSEATARERP